MAQPEFDSSFSLFGPYDFDGSAAPRIEPEYEPERRTERHPEKKSRRTNPARKTAADFSTATQVLTKEDERLLEKRKFFALRFLALVAAAFVAVTVLVNLNTRIYETQKQIAAVENKIDEAKSENIRLAAALESKVSISRVEDYAKNVLGMVKLENYKITFLEEDAEKNVEISGGKTYGERSSLSEKIKDLLEYLGLQ